MKENTSDSSDNVQNLEHFMSWATEIQALAQNGLHYCDNVFDKQRYERLLNLAAEMLSQHSVCSQSELISIFNKERGYATPKLDVRGAVFQNKQILMVKEIQDGKWSLPGGWADVNQTPAQCVEREILEESGYTCKATKLIGLVDKTKGGYPPQFPYAYKAFFLCELLSGTPTPSPETSDIAFFSRDQLPPLSQDRISEKHLNLCFDYFDNPNKEAYFD